MEIENSIIELLMICFCSNFIMNTISEIFNFQLINYAFKFKEFLKDFLL